MFFLQQKNRTNILANSLILILSALTIIKLQTTQLDLIQKRAESTSIAEIERKVKADKNQLEIMGKLPSFGYDNLIANVTFLNFLQYFGEEEAREKTGYTLSPDYFEVILNRDPRFLNAYFFLSSSTSIYAGMPEKTVAIMNEKLKILSPKDPRRAYYIWRYKGVDELLFFGDLKTTQHSFEKAAEWASVYSDEEGKNVAKVSRETANFLATNPDLTEARILGWNLVYNNAPDDRTREIAIQRMAALGANISIDSEGRLLIEIPQPNN